MIEQSASDLEAQASGTARLLVGYDVNGFTAMVEAARASFGSEAGELAAAAVLAGRVAFASQLEPFGFAYVDDTGDGIIMQAEGLGEGHAAAIDTLLAAAATAHLAASGLSVRTACASGGLRHLLLGDLITGQSVLLWGEAVAQLHRRLAGAERSTGRQLAQADRRAGLLLDVDSQVCDERFLVVRLATASTWGRATKQQLLGAIAEVGDWTKQGGGRLERISHDEKGILLRASTPLDAKFDPAEIGALLARLRDLGLPVAAALAEGPIYRSVGSNFSHMHGGVINWCAKAAATLDDGELRLGAMLTKPRSATQPTLQLVARTAEKAAALDHWEAERGGLVALAGPAGIGKSRLAEAILSELQAAGCAVAAVQCKGQSRYDPLGSVRQIFGQQFAQTQADTGAAALAWVQAVMRDARIDPVWADDCAWFVSAEPAPLRQLSEAATTARAHVQQRFAHAGLVRLAAQAPIAALIDDAQLIDPYSLEVLHGLLSGSSNLKLLMTLRAVPETEAWAELARVPRARIIELGGLGYVQIALIAASVAPKLSQERLDQIAGLANGNPFFATIAAGLDEHQELPANETITRLLARQMAAMSAADRIVLRVLACANGPVELDLLRRILLRLDLDFAQATMLDGLRRSPLAAVSANALRISHALVGDAVMASMPVGALAATAGAIAAETWRDLRAAPLSPEGLARLARYWDLARVPGRAAASYAKAAASATQAGYANIAAELLAAALTVTTRAGLSQHQAPSSWPARRAEALWASGNLSEAHELAEQAAQQLARRKPTPRVREARARVAVILSETGYFQGKVGAVLKSGLMAGRHGAGDSRMDLVRCRSYSSIGYMAGVFRVPWLPGVLFARARKLGTRHSDSRPDAFASTTEGILNLVFCRWQACDQALLHARACLAGWSEEQQLAEVIGTMMGHSAIFQGQAQHAREQFTWLHDHSEMFGNRLHLAWSKYMLGLVALNDGALDQAADLVAAAQADLARQGDALSDHIVLGLSARIAWARGERDQALALALQSEPLSAAIAPTNFSSLEGFAAAPLIYGLAALEQARSEPLNSAPLRPLRRFARLFPHARPRLTTIAALHQVAAGRLKPADALDRAVRFAELRGMHGEARLAAQIFETARALGER